MSDLFDFGKKIEDYAVMGNPISHSKSPSIHTLFAEQTQQSILYTAIHVDLEGFNQAVGNFAAAGGKGLNITVPFKQEAWELVTERSERAERAGAVNTIKINGDQLFGDNTDGVGLVNDLTINNGIELTGKNILLMGAGGAARGVLVPLLKQNPSSLFIANRTPDKAKDLALDFSDAGNIEGGGYEHLPDKKFDIVINATAASLQGYGAKPTPFMNWATEHKAAKVLDGLGMLVEQAAESFYIWRNIKPETKTVIEKLRKELQA
jgi:shikimate dehydrogenase